MSDCECVSCHDCNGMGFVSVPTEDYPEDDVETCPTCRGSGVTERCESCCDMEDRNSNREGH